MTTFNTLISISTLIFAVSGCGTDGSGSSSGIEDTSPSGTAAAVIGGALGSSSTSGTLASNSILKHTPTLNFISEALASVPCPTYKSTNGSGCYTNGSSNAWLTYNFCSFGASSAEWTGTQGIFLSSGTAACGALPYPTGTNKSIVYQFVTHAASTTPSTASRTNDFGSDITVDDASPNLAKFDPAAPAIATLANGGYGTKVNVSLSGGRSSVVIARRIYSSIFDHSITGTVTLSDAPVASGSTTSSGQLVSGSLKVYHNLLKVVGTSTFSNVLHTDACCLPVRGTITTAFTAGPSVTPTAEGALLVGKSEVLTLNGCGSGTLTKVDGTSVKVALSNCF